MRWLQELKQLWWEKWTTRGAATQKGKAGGPGLTRPSSPPLVRFGSWQIDFVWFLCRYLLENQLSGPSSVEAYIDALKKGCKCVECKFEFSGIKLKDPIYLSFDVDFLGLDYCLEFRIYEFINNSWIEFCRIILTSLEQLCFETWLILTWDRALLP